MEQKPLTPGADLRIMTSNALFDKTAEARAGLLYENIRYYNPDIIGFQEINEVLHKVLISRLIEDLGYDMVSAWPDEGRRRDFELQSLSPKYPSVNYFPILYKKSRFCELESGFYMYRSTWTQTKGVTYAILSESSSGRRFAHINTHAAVITSWYKIENLTPDLDEQWRLDNSRQILETKAEIIEKYGNIPIFLTGDFNSNEKSASYAAYIAGGFENSKYKAERSASRNIGSFHKVGEMPPQGEDTLPIDHIFVTPDIRVLVHSIETTQSVLDSSDHCMVYADVLPP